MLLHGWIRWILLSGPGKGRGDDRLDLFAGWGVMSVHENLSLPIIAQEHGKKSIKKIEKVRQQEYRPFDQDDHVHVRMREKLSSTKDKVMIACNGRNGGTL